MKAYKPIDRIMISYMFFLFAVCVIILDLTGMWNFGDIAFLFAFGFLLVFILLQKSTARPIFVVSFYLLFLSYLSYIPTGTGRITERLSEWFFLTFVFGIILSIKNQIMKKHI